MAKTLPNLIHAILQNQKLREKNYNIQAIIVLIGGIPEQYQNNLGRHCPQYPILSSL
jgi:hypothetical protein